MAALTSTISTDQQSSTSSPLSTPSYVDSLISKIYYDPKQIGAYYGSVKKIYQNQLLRKHSITESQIKQWLMSQEAATVHRGIHRRFKKNSFEYLSV